MISQETPLSPLLDNECREVHDATHRKRRRTANFRDKAASVNRGFSCFVFRPVAFLTKARTVP